MSEQGDIVSLVLAAIGGGGLGSLLLGSAQVWLGRRKPQLDEADLSTKWADLAQRAFTEASSARRETDALRLRVDVLEKKTHADARRIRGLLAYITYLVQRIREIDPNAVIDPLPDHLA